jgi:hypothetical protein
MNLLNSRLIYCHQQLPGLPSPIAAGGGGLRRLHGQFTITGSTGGCAAIRYDHIAKALYVWCSQAMSDPAGKKGGQGRSTARPDRSALRSGGSRESNPDLAYSGSPPSERGAYIIESVANRTRSTPPDEAKAPNVPCWHSNWFSTNVHQRPASRRGARCCSPRR